MIAAAVLVTGWLLALPAPCDDLPGERAALARAASENEAHFADVAAALEQRCQAPLAAGVDLEGPAAEAARELGDRLGAFCTQAGASGRPALKAGDREALAEILARPEFAQARAPDVNGGLERLVAWITAWMDSLFATSGAQSFAKGTRVLVLALALAVVLGV
ncbi:MAG TPA: hypothetical protein VND93_10430, partial [Myxococcales bacterium]|nr:hypothetical protein [Myxococcales bacterium]